MVILALAITLGCAGILLWPMAPWLWSPAVCLAVCLFIRVPSLRVAVAASALAGAWCAVVAHDGLARRVVAPARGVVEGCVASAVVLDAERVRFEFEAHRFDGRRVRQRLRLSWYNGIAVPAPGECWRLAVKLRPPRGLLNHRGADPERRAFVRGLHGVGYVDGAAARLGVDHRWRAGWLRTRLGMAARTRFLAGEGSHHGLFAALSVGLRHGLGPSTWRVFEATGTGHLVAISGLHVGIVAGLGFAVGRWLLAPLGWLAGRRSFADAQVGWAVALAAAFAYAALAGFSLPTRRALIMVAILGLATLRRVRVATFDSLSGALIVVLILSPLSVIHAGTWLSFGAVAFLLTLALRPAGHPMLAQVVVFCGLLPVLATFIGRLSLVGPLANAVCVPLFSVLVVPATLLAGTLSWLAPGLAMGLYSLLDTLLELTWDWLASLASLPLAMWTLPAAHGWSVLLALLAVGLGLTCARSLRARVVAVAACLPLALARAERPAHGDFRVEVYDVGQALAVSIFTRRHVVLYDAGARWRRSDAGAAIVGPQLRAAGVRAISDLVISHADLDHRGGLPSLLATYAVPRILVGEALPAPNPTPSEMIRCHAGQSWLRDGVRFSFVHPRRGSRWRGNDSSCVLRIDGRGGSALVTGDVEALAELSMVHGGRVRPVDLVVGQHHGSASSSTPAFIAATGARSVVFSTGFDNRWSLPSEVVVGRWRRAGARVFDTACDGGVQVHIGGHRAAHAVSTARRTRAAWWRSEGRGCLERESPQHAYRGSVLRVNLRASH